MRIPKGFADEVRHQIDIVRVVSEYVTLKRRGANYLALCPFHQEKTPSFNVHPGKQIFKCFGCGRGGDVFGFIMGIEGCDFPEAVRLLAEQNGIPIPSVPERREPIEAAEKERQWRDTLFQMNRWAQEFFQEQLKTAEGRRALDYLSRRGLRPETIQPMQIGYAPQSWEALSAFLRRRRVPEDHLARSGLVVLREDGQGNYDRFRGRIIFPIADSQGRVIAFGGRALETDDQSAGPKYLNSPETAIYTKGRHLFGLSQAKETIRLTGCVVLVEGYFDFLIPFQAGIHNIVASLGTALTEAQVSLLRRYASKVIVNFDPDPAGRAAAMRSLQLLMQHGFDLQVMVLPEGQDPDSFVRQLGVSEYRRLMSQALSYLDFVIAQATASADLNQPSDRAQALRDILPYVAIIPDRIEQAASSDRVANRLMLDPKLVQDEVRREVRNRSDAGLGRGHAEPSKADSALTRQAQATRAERLLLEILLNRPDVIERLIEELKEKADAFNGTVTAPLFKEILACLDRAEPLEYATLAQPFQDREDLLDLLERSFMVAVNRDAETVYHEAKDCLASLEGRRLEHELRLLQQEIDRAQQRRDSELSNQLSMRKREVQSLLARNKDRTNVRG
ncbi:MAG: DNA primase [Acidobacteria bacterium]|nr:DNA primase [Acidobacteriota bacterium]